MNTERTSWTKTEGAYTRCGITKRSCHEIGEIVWIELPKVGSKIKQGDLVAVVESTKAAFDIYAPISGVILEVNNTLLESIESLNKDPEGSGWLYKVQVEE